MSGGPKEGGAPQHGAPETPGPASVSWTILQAVLDYAPIGIWLQKPDGRLLFVNRTWCTSVGIPEEGFLAVSHYAELYDEVTARNCMASDRAALAQAGPHTSWERLRFVDGQIHDVEIVKVRLTSGEGRPEGLIGLSMDITERRRAEGTLQRQQEGLRKLNEVASLPGLDPQEMLRRALQVGAQHLGMESGAIGRIAGDTLRVEVQSSPPGRLEDGQELALDRTFATLTLAAGEITAIPDLASSVHRDHPARELLRTAAYVGAPLRLGGKLFGTLGFSSTSARPAGFDATDLEFVRLLARWVESTLEGREAVRRLRESESRLAGIIDSAMDAIITLDEEQRVLVFNAAAEAAFGCPAAEVLGRPLDRFIPERYREAHREHVRAFAATGRTTRAMGELAPITALRASGEEFPCEASISRADAGGRQLLTVILRDITERVRAEAARRELEAKVRQAQKMEALGTLAGGIAHDFNNILSVVLMNAELALPTVTGLPEAAESVDAIVRAGKRAQELVRHILTFSRKQPQKRTAMELRPTLDEAVRFMRAALPAGADLLASFGSRVPRVWADPTEIHQVAINLCTNAWHALAGGHGRIELRLEGVVMTPSDVASDPDLHPGSYALLSVSDTGHGMDEATRERIFEPFFTTKEAGRGTGLGLSVVHGIVKQMGGSIDVKSQPGQGSTFRVFFPAADPSEVPEVTREVAFDAVPGRGERVLYVDDEEQVTHIAARILERAGFQVTCFARPESALDAVRRGPDRFEVVVADVNMPGMSGIELARELRRLRPGLALVLTTGNLTQGLEAEAAKLGIERILEKPYSMAELRDAVAALTCGGRG